MNPAANPDDRQRGAEIRKNRDFWIPKIERNIQRDLEVNAALEARGWAVLRFWEHEIRDKVEACVADVRRALRPDNFREVNGC